MSNFKGDLYLELIFPIMRLLDWKDLFKIQQIFIKILEVLITKQKKNLQNYINLYVTT